MKKVNLFLVAAILALLVFIGFLGETEPQNLFGYSVNIWFYRIAWLLLSAALFMNYLKMKKGDKE